MFSNEIVDFDFSFFHWFFFEDPPKILATFLKQISQSSTPKT
jgi:hypothetical protein